MSIRFYLTIVVMMVVMSSCLKQSIADAMLNEEGTKKITATLSYEINGNKVNVLVPDAGNQVQGNRKLYCEKMNGFVLSALVDNGDFVFTFFTDSLRLGNYQYLGSYGPSYVTSFEGRPQYVYAASDRMIFNITTNSGGHISGNFSGRLTPYTNPGYGAIGSVVITNGLFTNVPVFY
jgi:hypothetical protein